MVLSFLAFHNNIGENLKQFNETLLVSYRQSTSIWAHEVLIFLFYPVVGRNEHALYAANIFISKAIRTTREMITKRISGQQKQPGSFILQARALIKIVSCCRVYMQNIQQFLAALAYIHKASFNLLLKCQ